MLGAITPTTGGYTLYNTCYIKSSQMDNILIAYINEKWGCLYHLSIRVTKADPDLCVGSHEIK